MFEEAFTKNYSTGTVWDPPLWIPYSSMMLGSFINDITVYRRNYKIN